MRVGVGDAWVVTALVAGCSSAAPTAPAPAAGSCKYDALTILSTYDVSSELGGFTLKGTGYVEHGMGIGGDPALATSAGRAFYLARDLGQMFEVDPFCGTPLSGTRVFDLNYGSAGGSTNPQDVAVAPDTTLWVPRYNDPSVLVIQPDGGVAASLDLSTYDPDGNPEATAVAIALVGDAGAPKAFVALEVLDDTHIPVIPYPDRPSLMLRIDAATRQIETSLPLVGRNPFGIFVPFDGALWLAEPGSVDAAGEALAGVERFDPQTSTSSLVVKESDVGGASIMQVALTTDCGAAIVADPSAKNLTALITFDPDSGSLYTTWSDPVFGPTTDYDLTGMLWVGSVLLVGDRTVGSNGQYAVHAFELAAPCTLHERPDTIFVQLPPVAFTTPPK